MTKFGIFVVTTAVSFVFLILMGMVQERDDEIEKLEAQKVSLTKCPPPGKKEIMHMAQDYDDHKYVCSYTSWKPGFWHLDRTVKTSM